MHGRKNSASDGVGKGRLELSDALGVQPFEPRRRRGCGAGPQKARGGLVGRDLQRTAAPVVDQGAGLGGGAADEVVVEIEAAQRQLEERTAFVRFDVRREHSGRRLRRSARDRARVEQPNLRAAPRKLARDRATNDAGTHDDDACAFAHEAIILARFGLSLES